MGYILHIESTTTQCSVALAKEGKVISLFEYNDKQYSHAEKLHVFIQKCLDQASLSIDQLSAVAVSKGPGSYTGLRIGVSAAKGICFALGIPLISVSTLLSMAHQVSVSSGVVIPVLDARRDEVYSAVFDSNYCQVREIKAEVIYKDSFNEYLEQGLVHVVGPGSEKCNRLLDKHPNLTFESEDLLPSARQMVSLAYELFSKKEFEDVAYFEPFYLKDFIAIPSNKI